MEAEIIQVEPTQTPEKIVIKKTPKPRAKTTTPPIVKVKQELDENEVIEFIKGNDNIKKEILKILLSELINKI